MSALVVAEVFKLTRRRLTWVLAVFAVGLPLLVYLGLLLALSQAENGLSPQQIADLENTLTLKNVVPFGYGLIWQIIALLGIILTSSAIGTEFGWRTVVTITAWNGDRVRLILAKLLVLAGMAAIGVALGFLAAVAGSILASTARDIWNWGDVSGRLPLDALAGGLRTWFVVLVYVLLAAALTMGGRNTTMGIAVGLATLFFEGLTVNILRLLGDDFKLIRGFLLSHNVNAVLAANGQAQGADPAAPTISAWRGALVLTLYSLAFTAITLATFQRRDLTE